MDRNERKTSQRSMGNRTRGMEKKLIKYKKRVLLLGILCGVLLLGNIVLLGRFVIWERVVGDLETEMVYAGRERDKEVSESEAISEVNTELVTETEMAESNSEEYAGLPKLIDDYVPMEEPVVITIPRPGDDDSDQESESVGDFEAETASETESLSEEAVSEMENLGEETEETDPEGELETQIESIFEEVLAGEAFASYRLIGLGELAGVEIDSADEETATLVTADELGALYVLGAMYARLTEDAVVNNDLPDLRTLAEIMMERIAVEGTDRAGEVYSLSPEAAMEELVKRIGGEGATETVTDDTDYLLVGLEYVTSFCQNAGFADTMIGGDSDTDTNLTSLADTTEFMVKLYEIDETTGLNGLSMQAYTTYSFQRKLEEILGTEYADGREKSALVNATLSAADWIPASDVLSEEEYLEYSAAEWDTAAVTEAGYYYPKVMWVSEIADDQSAEYTVLMVLFDSSGADVHIWMDADEAPDYDNGYVLGVFDSSITDPFGWREKMENLAGQIYEAMLGTMDNFGEKTVETETETETEVFAEETVEMETEAENTES